MSVSGIDYAGLVLNAPQVNGIAATSAVSGLASAQNATGTGDTTPAATVDISKPSQIYSELQQLQTQDPTKFKQVVSDIANKLQSLAQRAGQTPQGQWLTKLADKFQQVASTGNLSVLQPPQQPSGSQNSLQAVYGQGSQNGQANLSQLQSGGGPHHHHGGSQTTGSTTVQSQLAGIFQELDQATSTTSTTA